MTWKRAACLPLLAAAGGLAWLAIQADSPPLAGGAASDAAPEPPAAAQLPPLPTPPHEALGGRAAALREEPLGAPFDALKAVASAKRAPGGSDWLAQHREPGQSLAEFRAQLAPLPGRVVYLTSAGPIDGPHGLLLSEVERIAAAYFQLEVQWLPPIPRELAGREERQNDYGPQWLTHSILDALVARRPADAVALMALTQVDLYPDPTWNFVYGQARYGERVAVASMARDWDAETERWLALRRTLATATHEIGHMFGLRHCIAFECAMNGSNHRAEADARPLEPCPACLAKLTLAIGLAPEKRWRELAALYAGAGFGADAVAVTRAQRAAGAVTH